MSAKQRKKRNKPYRGLERASQPKPSVHRYTAVQRSPMGEWWHKRKKLVIRLVIAVAAIALISWFLVEAFALIFAPR